MRRPWRIEYLDAEGVVRVQRSFHFRRNAIRALPGIKAENPGVMFVLRKHVEFDAGR